MNCKILDQGNEAVHFGASLGGGIYVVKDEENDTVTVCRHPAGDVQAPPDVVIERAREVWDDALAHADRIPEHRAVKEERERKAAERDAKRHAELAAREARLQTEQAERDAAKAEKDKK